AATGHPPTDLPTTLHHLAGQLELDQYRWYTRPDDERFPIEQDATSIKLLSNALKSELDRPQTRLVHMAARVILEKKLNHMLEETKNKSSVLFSVAAIHLDYLLKNFGQQ